MKRVRAADFDSAIPRFESWRPSQPVQALEIFPTKSRESPPIGGLVASCKESPRPEFDNSTARCAGNLCATSAIFPFSGEIGRRLGSIELRDRFASAKSANLP